MKILMLIDRLDPGGAETHVVTLARALKARGHTVEIFCEGGALEAMLSSDGIPCHHPPRPLRGKGFLFGFFACLRSFCRLQKRQGYDVLHAHTRRTALLLRWLRPAPAASQRTIQGYRKGALRRIARPLKVVSCHAKFSRRGRLLSYWGERTVAVSEDLKRHLTRNFSVPASRIAVIPNGIDLSHFCPAEKRSSSTTLKILFASRLDADCSSAAEHLISLFPALRCTAQAAGRELTLTILGGGEQYAALQKKASGEKNIHLPGATADPVVEMQAADLFVGVSRAALEAMACGCEVILAGNEGFFGPVHPENFLTLAGENFTARACPPLTKQALEAALGDWLAARLAAVPTREGPEELRELLVGRFDSEAMAGETETLYCRALSARRRLRVLLAGYAGCGNLGDDAILRQIIAHRHGKRAPATPAEMVDLDCPLTEEERNAAPTLRLRATTGGDASFAIPTVPRRRPISLLRAILRADALCLGGGGLLQNCSAHGDRSLCYYLGLLAAARCLRRPTYLLAGGVGPLLSPWARGATGRALRAMPALSVRDVRSYALVRDLGVPKGRVVQRPDPAERLSVDTLCPGDHRRARRLLIQLFGVLPPRERLAIVVPRATDGASEARLVDRLAHSLDPSAKVLFLPFDHREDGALCRRLAAHLGGRAVSEPLDERQMMALFARSSEVISGRLHGLILARAVGTPASGIICAGADRKVRDFAAQWGDKRILI